MLSIISNVVLHFWHKQTGYNVSLCHVSETCGIITYPYAPNSIENTSYALVTSGAIQYGVPTEVLLRPSVSDKWEATPKSTSLTWASLVKRMLWPLISRCIT